MLNLNDIKELQNLSNDLMSESVKYSNLINLFYTNVGYLDATMSLLFLNVNKVYNLLKPKLNEQLAKLTSEELEEISTDYLPLNDSRFKGLEVKYTVIDSNVIVFDLNKVFSLIAETFYTELNNDKLKALNMLLAVNEFNMIIYQSFGKHIEYITDLKPKMIDKELIKLI